MRKRFAVAMTTELHRAVAKHLLQHYTAEDVCFATWRPLTGATRTTAILSTIVLPIEGDRFVHGNASFTDQYLLRAIAVARRRGEGLAFMHNHLAPGWQGMSLLDVRAEQRIAPTALGATNLPLVGLTLGSDGAWSARRWVRTAPRTYARHDAENVRVVGDQLQVTHVPRPGRENDRLLRTTGVWGRHHETLVRLRVGVVGLGSLGSIQMETLARGGFENVISVDGDILKAHNLDRTPNAYATDVGQNKVDVAAEAFKRSATATCPTIRALPLWCDHPDALLALLDCDVIFSCVDRPWPRRILNQVAYAALIPVVNAGILVSHRRENLVGADWHVQTAGPGRRCLECWGAFDPSDAAADRDELFENPFYIRQMDSSHPMLRRANVFSFSCMAASMAFHQMTAMIVGPVYNHGDQNYHYATGHLDLTPDAGCLSGCVYLDFLGAGDTGLPPTRKSVPKADHSTRTPA